MYCSVPLQSSLKPAKKCKKACYKDIKKWYYIIICFLDFCKIKYYIFAKCAGKSTFEFDYIITLQNLAVRNYTNSNILNFCAIFN